MAEPNQFDKRIGKLEKGMIPEASPRIIVCWHTDEQKAAGECDCTPEGESVKVVTWDDDDES